MAKKPWDERAGEVIGKNIVPAAKTALWPIDLGAKVVAAEAKTDANIGKGVWNGLTGKSEMPAAPVAPVSTPAATQDTAVTPGLGPRAPVAPPVAVDPSVSGAGFTVNPMKVSPLRSSQAQTPAAPVAPVAPAPVSEDAFNGRDADVPAYDQAEDDDPSSNSSNLAQYFAFLVADGAEKSVLASAEYRDLSGSDAVGGATHLKDLAIWVWIGGNIYEGNPDSDFGTGYTLDAYNLLAQKSATADIGITARTLPEVESWAAFLAPLEKPTDGTRLYEMSAGYAIVDVRFLFDP